MIQLGKRTGFVEKQFDLVLRGGQIRREEFQRDDSVQADVASFVDDTHAALGDLADQFVMRNVARRHGACSRFGGTEARRCQ